MTENDQAIEFLTRTGDHLYGRDWIVPLAREMEISPNLVFNWISRKTPITMTDEVWLNVFYVLGLRGNRYQDFMMKFILPFAMLVKIWAIGGKTQTTTLRRNIFWFVISLHGEQLSNLVYKGRYISTLELSFWWKLKVDGYFRGRNKRAGCCISHVAFILRRLPVVCRCRWRETKQQQCKNHLLVAL